MFSTAPQNMVNLYQPGSCLIWEGTRYDGQQAISEKLQQMGAQRLCFDTPKIDCCMSNNSNSLLIFVTSKLTIGGENALHVRFFIFSYWGFISDPCHLCPSSSNPNPNPNPIQLLECPSYYYSLRNHSTSPAQVQGSSMCTMICSVSFTARCRAHHVSLDGALEEMGGICGRYAD